MQTQTMNNEHFNQKTVNDDLVNRQPSLLQIIAVSVVGSMVLIGGFIMSLFLLALSAIMLPFAAIRIWLFQKRFNESMKSRQASPNQGGTIIEGEYVVTESKRDDQ